MLINLSRLSVHLVCWPYYHESRCNQPFHIPVIGGQNALLQANLPKPAWLTSYKILNTRKSLQGLSLLPGASVCNGGLQFCRLHASCCLPQERHLCPLPNWGVPKDMEPREHAPCTLKATSATIRSCCYLQQPQAQQGIQAKHGWHQIRSCRDREQRESQTQCRGRATEKH